jgi:outer membrane porin, OprD family
MRLGFGMKTDTRLRISAWVSMVVIAVAAIGSTGTAFGADVASALENMLVNDSKVTLQLRTYAMDRQRPGPVSNEAWAAGGWLAYQSGWLADALSFGLVGYTSQPLWAPADADGTLLLAPGQEGYSVLGQAYVSLKLLDQTLTGGRFEVNQPEVNLQDNRMTPNTFEGGRLSGQLGGVNYFAGYLKAQKRRNATSFVDMATVAGAPPDVSSPMWLIGFGAEPVKDLALRFSSYHVPDILNSSYADGAWLTTLSDAYRLRLGAQAMVQESTGSDALTGSSFSTWSGGVRADLIAGAATATFAYTQTGRGAAYRTPYASWAGYTSMIFQDFNQAGQKAALIGGTYDFAGLQLPGMVLNAAIAFGRDQIEATTGAALPNLTEYDMTLDYRFSAKSWPQWVQPLWIRARAAYLDQSAAGHTTDYRIIVNYPWTLK